MNRWIRPAALAGLAVVVIAALAFFANLQDNNLHAARADTKHALERAAQEQKVSDAFAEWALDAVERAARAEATADSLRVVAKAGQARVRAAVVQSDSVAATAPDTCTTYLEAVANARDLAADNAEIALRAADSARAGYDSLSVVNDSLTASQARLRASLADLSSASTELVKATRPSFWKFGWLKPDLVVSTGVTHGIDVQTGERHTVAGVQAGLGWRIKL